MDGIISTIFSDLFVSQSVNGLIRKHSNPEHHMLLLLLLYVTEFLCDYHWIVFPSDHFIYTCEKVKFASTDLVNLPLIAECVFFLC